LRAELSISEGGLMEHNSREDGGNTRHIDITRFSYGLKF